MSLTKTAMSVFCILFFLLYTFSSGKRRDSGWEKLKATLTKKKDVDSGAKKPAGHFVDAGEVFLTKLYNKHFHEDGRMKTRNAAISEIIHSVQGNGTSFLKKKIISSSYYQHEVTTLSPFQQYSLTSVLVATVIFMFV